MELQTFKKLIETCVNPVLNYGAEIWGFKDYATCKNIQMKAMKFYLGVPRGAPNVGVLGEFSWLKPQYERWFLMCRYWNRLISTDHSRLLYRVFKYDYNICKNNWCSELKHILMESSLLNVYTGKEHCSLESVKKR